MKGQMSGIVERFAPFTKVDDELRMVWGRATDETPDSEGEVVDYEATKRAVGEWAQWRNVREMHEGKAAGTAEEIRLDDAAKALEVGVRVVDEGAWQKVKAGVYKGFSIGGKKLASVVEKASGGTVTRITDYLLTEISLVDRPANPSAVFSMVKRAEEPTPPPSSQDGKGETEGEAPAKDGGADGGEADGGSAEGEGEAPTDGEEQAAPEDQAMTVERLRSVVLALLEEVGLIRRKEPGGGAGGGQAEGGMGMAEEVADLRKRLEQESGLLAKQAADGARLAELSGDVAKIGGGLGKLASDLAKAAMAVDALDERLETLEKRISEAGPVRPALREIGLFGGVQDAQGASEASLKALMQETDDPMVKQVLGRELAKLQIKAVQAMGGSSI